MFDFISDAVEGSMDFVGKAVRDPIGTATKVALQPIRNTVEVIDGLMEGELRTKAALSLGADVVSGMALSEVIDWYNDTH